MTKLPGYLPLDVVKLKVVEAVDCGTCPVTLACAMDKGGNGYTFNCCHATGVPHVLEDGGTVLLMVDCAAHNFEKNEEVDAMPTCPLCSGDAVVNQLLGLEAEARWLPTVHAKVPAKKRLETFRAAVPVAEKLRAVIEARRKSL